MIPGDSDCRYVRNWLVTNRYCNFPNRDSCVFIALSRGSTLWRLEKCVSPVPMIFPDLCFLSWFVNERSRERLPLIFKNPSEGTQIVRASFQVMSITARALSNTLAATRNFVHGMEYLISRKISKLQAQWKNISYFTEHYTITLSEILLSMIFVLF